MPQLPTKASPDMFIRAQGLNDEQAATKQEPGYIPFALNLSATGDVWTRRAGRDFYFLDEVNGGVLAIKQLTWADGLSINIAVIGGAWYDLGAPFTYLFEAGIRLVIQSPDLNYWDVTPDATTGLINPTVVSAPSATAQTSNVTLGENDSIGFVVTGGIVRLNVTEEAGIWFLEMQSNSPALSFISDDWVFTIASGFSLRITDSVGNVWSFSVDNGGNLLVTTV